MEETAAEASVVRIGDVPELAGISADRLTSAQAGLSPELRRLHRAILDSFVQLGSAPDQDRLKDDASKLGLDMGIALEQLEESDLIVRDRPTGRIVGVYPFSAVPTRHRVHIADGKPVYAMCAIDALGIPDMLGKDGVIVSEDPVDSSPIRVEVHAGRADWNPASAVVFVGSTGQDGSIAQTCCSVINFFASPASAKEFQTRNPGVTGRVLSQQEALELGRSVFGQLAREDRR